MRGWEGSGLADGGADYQSGEALTPVQERLVQAIWAGQMFQPEGLRTVEGQPIRVLDPGRWNGAGGPDFKGAQLLIHDRTAVGDVEIHVLASQWRAHGHERDLDYNGVILHVVLRNDDGATGDRLHNGSIIPRLELEPYVFPDLETIRRSVTPDDFPYDRPPTLGRCHEMMMSLEAPALAELLDRAGDERFAAKIARVEAQSRAEDLDQVFYQTLMLGLGSGPGKSLYYLLAKRAPLADLLDEARQLPPEERRLGIEAILLHVGGLVPDAGERTLPDEETRAYRERVHELWSRFAPAWSDRLMPPTRRWFRGLRPVNFPLRRLSAVAALLNRGLRTGRTPLAEAAAHLRALAPTLETAPATRRAHPAVRECVRWLRVEGDQTFWARRYTFAAEPAARPLDLIGEATARSLALNAMLPALVVYARRQEDAGLERAARRLFEIFPALPPNHITTFMGRRLFGDSPRARDVFKTERRQQALFQIFYACCSGEERHCDLCYYFKQG